MLGAPVDAIETIGADLSAFVVALVRDVQPHPDADKLRVTSVDDGSGVLHTVVCGAPNVTAGARYPFARLGTTMPGGLVIERRKIRGLASEGMLCSARELGLGADSDGLMTLTTDAPPGTPLRDVLSDEGDERLVLDITPNRPDLLCHKGVARELAIGFGAAIRLPEISGEVSVDLPTPERSTDRATVGGIDVSIIDSEGCGRLLTAVIRGVTVAPSPAWLVRRLEAVGLRSINNVVDVTNYVMLELNQPMHAYDANSLRGPAIIVRSAGEGERVVTLDGVERKVSPGTLVIADAERVIGLAGVMGGAATEVNDATIDLLLECAWFNPSRVRAGRNAAGLSTDASHRFERGVDRWGAVDAFRRAIRLIVTVAGGKLDATADCSPVTAHPPRIFLRPARVAQVLGVTLPWTEIERCLVAIGATIVSKPDDGRIAVDVPGWRPDLMAEIDLVEEIARVYGYDAIPSDLSPFRPAARLDDPAWHAAARLRNGLAALGLSEVMTLSMVADGSPSATRLANPLSSEHGLLRESLLPALISQVETNWSAQNGNVRLFEVGTVFSSPEAGARPHEWLAASFVVTGDRQPPHWSATGVRPAWDRWDARWLFERLVALAQPDASVQVDTTGWQAVTRAGQVVGHCHELYGDAPPWAKPVWGGEVQVSEQTVAPATFTPLPAFPAVSRDLALVTALEQPVQAVLELLANRGRRAALEAVSLVDEYRGSTIPADRRAITVRLIFRTPDRTLTDADVDQAVSRLCTSLERELGITLRTA
jgi:phenylalanyl-tRNA synthetase beta chain